MKRTSTARKILGGVLTVALVLGLSLIPATPASAAVTGVTYTDVTTQINAAKTVKVSSAASPLLKITIVNDANDVNLQVVKVQFASVSGFDKTDLATDGLGATNAGGLLLYKDAGVADTFESGADTFLATTNVWDGLLAQMTLNVPLALGANATTKYFVVVRTSATATNGDKFTANMGLLSLTAGGVQYGTGSLTTATVTVDDALPTVSSIAGTTIQGAGDTIAITFSESVKPGAANYGNGAGNWGPNIFSAIESPNGTGVSLAGATTSVTDNSTITSITITLADDAVNKALINGNTIAVTPAANAIQDLAANFMAVTEVVGTTATVGDTVAPGLAVSQIVGTTAAGAGDTIALTFSEKVRAADGTWDANEFSSIESPNGTPITLTNATFDANANLVLVTITLSDAIADAAWLTNGNVVAVTPAAGKITDLAGNSLAATEIVGTTLITGDTLAPAFASAAFTRDTNLEITFSERVKAVDASKLSSTSFTVASATVSSTDQTKVNVTISALSQTNQTNGVAGAVGLQLAAGAVTDLAGNSSALEPNKTIAADTTAPTITSGTLNYGTGVLTITANEKLDVSATSLAKIGIANTTSGDAVPGGGLTGATLGTVDGTTITITLTEAQRAAAILLSGQPGGDGAAVVINLDANALFDTGGVGNAAGDDGNPVTETPDTVKPTVSATTAATLNYGTGVLVITFSETIDGNPATNVDASKIWISNTAGSHNVQLTGATVAAADATTVTITLTAAQKAAAIAISGVTGGDGTAVVVDLDAGAVKDLAGNLNDLSNGNAVTETADTTAPTFVSANLTSSTNIDVTFNEGMGAVAASGSEFSSAGGRWTATAAAIDAANKTVVHVTVSGIDATEARGIAGDLTITRTALADLAGNAFVTLAGQNIGDKIAPTFTIAYFTNTDLTTAFTGDYMQPGGTYWIRITASEPLQAANPTISIAAEGTANDVTNAATTDVSGDTVFKYQRVVAADAAGLGNAEEVITITGVDEPVQRATDNLQNTSTNAAVTGEKKIDAAVTKPTLSSPGNATSTGDNTPTLTWNAVTDNNGPVTYRVEVDTENTFAAPTVADQAGLSVLTYTLPTAVANGTYYWMVVATDALGNQSTSDIWSFVVSADSTAPTVTVNSPNGGESLTGGSSATITWNATDNVTAASLLTIDLSYSTNGGSSWTSIATGESNDGAYIWTVPSINSSSVLVRVTATDAALNAGSDTSNAVFSITTAGAATQSISLAAGWNLISLPVIPTSTAIATVLSGVSSSIDTEAGVWSYNASTGAWTNWIPGVGGSLTTMTDGKGYWIKMTAAATLTVSGSELPAPPATPPTYSVAEGWNLVGFKSTTAKTNGAYLTGTNYRFPIYGYSGGAYTTISASSSNFETGKAYWVYFNAAGVVSP
ncbi:MAG: hypothetical protein HYX92_14840 [Chloroflexi bacterium]|nr:hypothetical protein [Chloroflexota bacterium]